jgi:hypothetical protein
MYGMKVQTKWNGYFIEIEVFNNGKITLNQDTLIKQVHIVSKGIKADNTEAVCAELYQRIMAFLSFDISHYKVEVSCNEHTYSQYSWKW